jgi:AcrR family transcriptional regulator
MSPRSSVKEAAQTRARIVQATVDRASTAGLEGVSVRDLAADLGMSKSGVLGPFDSRGDLLETALDSAVAMFRQAVITPTLSEPPGPDRLLTLIDRWVDYLVDCPFPGGCFISAASTELDGRPGRLRDRLADAVTRWRVFVVETILAAHPGDPEDAQDTATVLIGISMAANQEVQLLGDPSAGPRAKRAMRRATV